MRLWHQRLIPLLPRQQLLGQHRECCALRGNAWGKPHSVVNYVFRYDPARLYQYHRLVMEEMQRRGYRPDPRWKDPCYRGTSCAPYTNCEVGKVDADAATPIYVEHDDPYLDECLANLRGKGVLIERPNHE